MFVCVYCVSMDMVNRISATSNRLYRNESEISLTIWAVWVYISKVILHSLSHISMQLLNFNGTLIGIWYTILMSYHLCTMCMYADTHTHTSKAILKPQVSTSTHYYWQNSKPKNRTTQMWNEVNDEKWIIIGKSWLLGKVNDEIQMVGLLWL